MKRFNKFMSLLLALCFVLFMVGCGQQAAEQNPADDAQQEEAETPALDFPTKPVTFIVPYSAGGGTDISARILQSYAEQELGQPVTILNVPGSGGAIGFQQIATSSNDGYTIGYLNAPSSVTAYLDGTAEYEFDDYEYIITQTLTPRLLAVPADSQFNTIEELVSYAKENPGDITVANSGVAGFAHVTSLALEDVCGITVTHVPFDSGSDSLTAVLGHQVDAVGLSFGEAKAAYDEGQIKVLGLYTEEPSDTFPGVPTFKSAGYDIIMQGIQPIVAPAGTDPEIVEYLYEALDRVFQNPEYIEKMNEAGNIPTSKNGAETRQIIDDMLESFAPLMEKAN